MVTANPNFDALLSTTLANYRDTLEDNLSKNVPLWHFLKGEGRVTKKGGTKIIEQLMYGGNTTVASYAGYDPITVAPQTGITAAEYNWKQVAGTVVISGIEEAKNSGEYAQVDLLQSKIEQLEISLIDKFDVMFQGAGTGNSGKDFLGLGALIGDESSSVTTVGGIDATDVTNAWWRSYINRTAGALTIEDMTHCFYSAVRGSSQPKFAQTTLALFESYNAQLQANQRFTDPKTAEAGFRNLTFQGIPLMWGENVPSGTLTFVNPKYLRLNVLGDTWMKSTPFIVPNNEDSRSSKVLSYGELSTSNRKLAGSRLEGRTP